MKLVFQPKTHSSMRGLAAIEYALIIAILAAGVIYAVRQHNEATPTFFNQVADSFMAGDPIPSSTGGTPSPPPGSDDTGNPDNDDDPGTEPSNPADPVTPGNGGTDPSNPDPSDDNGSGDGAGDEGSGNNPDPGSGSGSGDDESPEPDAVIQTNIPYYWSNTYQEWFNRPAFIPPDDWNNRPFSVTASGPVNVPSQSSPGVMGWNGVTWNFATPTPGQSFEIRLSISGHVVLYRFTRAARP